MTTHCGALFLKEEFTEEINLPYIFHYLRNNLKRDAVGEQNKRVTLEIMKDIEVPIPYINGQIDLEEQKEISYKYTKLESIRNNIISQIYNLKEIEPTKYN